MENEVNWYGLMRAAIAYAITSPDPSTQNSAFLVLPNGDGVPETIAVNCFPDGVENASARWERPVKYSFVEHAERNSIYLAAREGIATKGLAMISPWASCADCARAIIQSGITKLVRYVSVDHLHWVDSVDIADQMLHEAGVEVVTLADPIPNVTPILRNGVHWIPDGVDGMTPSRYIHPLN